MNKNSILLIFIYFAICICSFQIPCSLKLIGGVCQVDEECYGTQAYCTNGLCQCGQGFEAYAIDNNTKVCRQAPSQMNAPCSSSCQEPLVCIDGRCKCEGGEIRAGRCVVDCPAGQTLRGNICRKTSILNAQCDADTDCVDAFTECRGKRCLCIDGAVLENGKCQAKCPDGSRPTRSCKRLFINDVDLLEHKASGDNCADSEYCATYGSPHLGACCPIKCPYGEADFAQTCDAGAPNFCRELTHFCQGIQAPGYSKSICCPRACREPNPLYIDGECRRMAHLGDACNSDIECEGNVTMACIRNKCRCKISDLKAGGVRYQEVQVGVAFGTCERQCATDQVPHGDQCIPNGVMLNSRCIMDKQCGKNAECYNGQCKCQCGFAGTSATGCTNPDDPLGLNQLGSLSNILANFQGKLTGG